MRVKYKQGRFNNRRLLSGSDLERLISQEDLPEELPYQIDWNPAEQHVAEVDDTIGLGLIAALPDEFEEYIEPEPKVEVVEDEPKGEVEKVEDEKPKPNSSSKKKKSDTETGDD